MDYPAVFSFSCQTNILAEVDVSSPLSRNRSLRVAVTKLFSWPVFFGIAFVSLLDSNYWQSLIELMMIYCLVIVVSGTTLIFYFESLARKELCSKLMFDAMALDKMAQKIMQTK